MDQPPSSELDLIEDPETGLALLAKCPDRGSPEQALNRHFWQIQFTYWRDWLAGDVAAVDRALITCFFSKRPPPSWLCKAISQLCVQHMSPSDKRAHRMMLVHFRRWEMAERVRRGRVEDTRVRKKKVRGWAVWEETAERVAGTVAKGDAGTMLKSHQLIKRAGGNQVSLPSYRRAVKERDRLRHRKNKMG